MRRKKLYYVPGLISLLTLPILFFIFEPEDPVYHNSIRLFIPRDGEPDENRLTTGNVFQFVKSKKITTVDFWNVDFYDERDYYKKDRKLLFIKKEIERLAFVHDTNAVLKIELGQEASYGEFVWMLNQSILYKMRRYALVNSTFYVFANEIPVDPATYEKMTIRVDNPSYEPGLMIPQGPTAWEKFWRELEYEMEIGALYLKYNKLLVAGFALLILVPFIIRFRKFQRLPALRTA